MRFLLAAGRLVTGFELEITQLPGVQRRTRPEIALILCQKVPDQDGELACRRHSGDVLPAPALHAQKETAQRARRAGCGPARLDQHAASVAAALLGDPPMVSRPRSRLPHARVQPEIADELLGFGKALDIADRGDQRERDNHINAGDGHQAFCPFVGERRLGKIAFDGFEIVSQPVELAEVALYCQPLIPRQNLFGKPGTALGATQILMRAGRDQMGVQDRLNNVLQPRALPHNLVAPRHLAT